MLWQGLADGAIDCIVSDHSPCTPDLKRLDTGDFGVAWGGIASLQLALPAVWTQARARGFTLADVTRWMSAAPAALAGLDRKGGLTCRPGRRPVGVRAGPDNSSSTRRNCTTAIPSPRTPGRTLTGVVRSTWLRGQELVGDQCRGQLLSSRAASSPGETHHDADQQSVDRDAHLHAPA